MLTNVFGEGSEFVSRAEQIKSGWVVAFEKGVSYMKEDSGVQLAQGKIEMYLELIDNAIHYAEHYMPDEPQKPPVKPETAGVYIDQLNANGGFFNFGDMSGASINIDDSIREIERRIQDEGGADKADLTDTLNLIKAYIEECTAEEKIVEKPGLEARINAHVVKHGWFYGAILQLLGTAALQYIG